MRWLLVSLVLMIGLLVSPVLAQDNAPTTESVDCWMPLPEGLVEGENVDCGYLNVPENRSDPSSQTIHLAFAVLHAPAEEVQPDPVIYLAGGPGGNAVGELESWLNTSYLEDRDFILLDQRGTGYSLPSLNCPENEEGEEDGTQACHDRLISEGINLQAYNSAENAADVADLRVALGYDEWNLYGISYGTRLALTIMRDFPEGIRSVVIDSVYPPEINSWEEYGENTADVFTRLFEACVASETCNEAYSDLGETFATVVEQLNAEPAEYTATDAETGEETDKTMSGDEFIDRIFQVMYSTSSIPAIPSVISEVANENYAALDELEAGDGSEEGFRLRQSQDEDVSDSEGMNLSVDCQEEVAFMDETTSVDNVPAEPASLYQNSVNNIQSTFGDCQIWNLERADQRESEPVESDIPTLVAAGEFDPITPAKWAESAASYLPNSTFFVFPGGGHGVLDMNDCSVSILQAFLDDPTQELDGSCIDEIGEPDWVVPS